VHVAQIVAEFGALPLSAVRPSQVRAWCTKLGEQGYATSNVLTGEAGRAAGSSGHGCWSVLCARRG